VGDIVNKIIQIDAEVYFNDKCKNKLVAKIDKEVIQKFLFFKILLFLLKISLTSFFLVINKTKTTKNNVQVKYLKNSNAIEDMPRSLIIYLIAIECTLQNNIATNAKINQIIVPFIF